MMKWKLQDLHPVIQIKWKVNHLPGSQCSYTPSKIYFYLGKRKNITQKQYESIKKRAFLEGLIYNGCQQGWCWPAEDIWQYQDLWLIVKAGGRVWYWYLVHRGQKCYLRSCNAWDSSFQQKIIQHQVSVVLRLRNPWL